MFWGLFIFRVGAQHGNLHQLSATMSRVTYFILQARQADKGTAKSKDGKITADPKQPRKLSQKCTSASCMKSKQRSCNGIPEEDRNEMLQLFLDKTWLESKKNLSGIPSWLQDSAGSKFVGVLSPVNYKWLYQGRKQTVHPSVTPHTSHLIPTTIFPQHS